MKSTNLEERFAYWTVFTVEEDTLENRLLLKNWLVMNALVGWFVETNYWGIEPPLQEGESIEILPIQGRVFHVKPDDLAGPPPGVRAERHTQEERDGHSE